MALNLTQSIGGQSYTARDSTRSIFLGFTQSGI